MDRIKACGNAVVPQVAQFIGRRIKEVMTTAGDFHSNETQNNNFA